MKYLLLMIALASCGAYVARDRPGEGDCDSFKKEIKEHWGRDANERHYNTSDKFLLDLKSKYKYCLYDRDSAYLVSLLGACSSGFVDVYRGMDSLKPDHSLFYTVITPSCSRTNGIANYYAEFIVDRKGRIKTYRELHSSVSTSH